MNCRSYLEEVQDLFPSASSTLSREGRLEYLIQLALDPIKTLIETLIDAFETRIESLLNQLQLPGNSLLN